MTYVITNANILDGTGREPFRGAVRVEGNRIAERHAWARTPRRRRRHRDRRPRAAR